jgi:sterol O-acyltransferase
MKQHSYAFYTGWLSNEYRRKQRLETELAQMEQFPDTNLTRVNSIEEDKERLLHEIESADRDLTGKILHQMKYPNNLTYANFLDYMLCPTLIYELEYPRTDKIHWWYVLEKSMATFGSIGLMIVISEHYVLPAIQPILPSQTVGMTLFAKLMELGWVLLDMIFPYLSPP